jgi:hypothetical protein
VADWLEPLTIGLRLLPAAVLINVHCATPPVWATEPSPGPLFAGSPPESPENAIPPEHLLEVSLSLSAQNPRRQIRWHLSQRDLVTHASGQPTPFLRQLACCLLEQPTLAVVLDRLRRPIRLGPGLDRQHPALLLAVTLHLPELLKLPAVGSDLAIYLHKLTNLVRLALSAAQQKRTFLQDQGRGGSGVFPSASRQFLPSRARLLVIADGLDVVARHFTRRSIDESDDTLELARHVLQHLQTALVSEGSRTNLTACLAGDGEWFTPGEGLLLSDSARVDRVSHSTRTAEVGPTRARLPLAAQLRMANQLQRGIEGASANLLMRSDRSPTPETLVDLLVLAWKETELQELRCTWLREQQPSFLEGNDIWNS